MRLLIGSLFALLAWSWPGPAVAGWPHVASRRSTAPVAGRAEPGYKLGPGAWPVNVVERLVLKDQRRKRSVEMSVRYPGGKATGKHPAFPLVVFSPDNGPSRAELPDLLSHWASHGYVVITPAVQEERPRNPHAERVPFESRQLERLADMTFVLDSLDHVEKHMDGFHGRHAAQIDRGRIGVSGYGAGALTAQMAVGVKVRVSKSGGEGELRSVGDPRCKAAVLISPQGTVNRMLTSDSWAELARPILVVTGSRDVVAGSRETPESREEPFTLAKPGQKFLLFIEGATHTSYSLFQATRADGASSGGPPVSEADARMMAGATASATLAFWDAFLLGDEHGRDYLASDDISRLSAGKAQIKRR